MAEEKYTIPTENMMKEVLISMSDNNCTVPSRVTPNSAGYDIFSNVDTTIVDSSIKTINTGLKMAIPCGYYGQLVSKSGLAKIGLTVVGGVIDSDYRGEIKVLLENHSGSTYTISKGMAIAQIVFLKCEDVDFEILSPEQWGAFCVEESLSNQRKDRGFGEMDKVSYV